MSPAAAAPANPPSPSLASRAPALLAWAVLAVLLWTTACLAPLVPWNAPRLASAFALAHGQPLYPEIGSGAQLGWFYGPGLAVWLLPVTLIGSPSWAIAAASLQNGLALLAGLGFALHAAGLRAGRLAAATGLGGLLLFCGGLTPQSWFDYVHVDAPCLALALVAGAAAWRHGQDGRARWLHLSGLAAAAACLTKQSSLLLPVAIVLGLLWLGPVRRAVTWGLVFAAYLAAGLAAACGAFGAGNLAFYTLTVHRFNPLKPGAGTVAFWVDVVFRLVVDVLPWLILGGLVLAGRRLRLTSPDPARRGPGPVRWYLWLGAAQLPIGLFAAGKAGGGLNSVHGLIFLLAALLGQLDRAAFRPRVLGLLTVFLCGLALATSGERLRHWRPDPYQDRLLALARAHPGGIFLPWNPLVTLLSDGRVYPFEDALHCLRLSRRPVADAQVRAALPPRAVLVYDPIAASHDAARYFPGITRVPIERLAPDAPGWSTP